jgi:hypothetical protein
MHSCSQSSTQRRVRLVRMASLIIFSKHCTLRADRWQEPLAILNPSEHVTCHLGIHCQVNVMWGPHGECRSVVACYRTTSENKIFTICGTVNTNSVILCDGTYWCIISPEEKINTHTYVYCHFSLKLVTLEVITIDTIRGVTHWTGQSWWSLSRLVCTRTRLAGVCHCQKHLKSK